MTVPNRRPPPSTAFQPRKAAIESISSGRADVVMSQSCGTFPIARSRTHPPTIQPSFPASSSAARICPAPSSIAYPRSSQEQEAKELFVKQEEIRFKSPTCFTFSFVSLIVLYTLSERREREQAPLMALPPRSSRVKDARPLSQKRPKKIYGNLSLFSHQPQSKKDAFRHPFIHPCWDVSSYTSDATHSRRSAEGTAR